MTVDESADESSFSSFVLSDGTVLQAGSASVMEIVTDLIYCYYAWGLTYPKDFQLLPFVQEHVLQDKEQVFKSAAYIKFNMKFRDQDVQWIQLFKWKLTFWQFYSFMLEYAYGAVLIVEHSAVVCRDLLVSGSYF